MRAEVKQLVIELKNMKGLEEIQKEAREETKNWCMNRILLGNDKEMKEIGMEGKYRIRAIDWLFGVYLENQIKPKVKPKVDKKED
jgi:hypothetical protein